jgi:hypothetical protein
VSDLGPLEGMRLTTLHFGSTRVTSLGPLKGMPMTYLIVGHQVSDLGPLKGMPLTYLWLQGAQQVSDLRPLKGMPLKELNIGHCVRISDLTPLEGMKLETLFFHAPNVKKGIEVIRSMNSLRHIGLEPSDGSYWTPEEFWKKYDAGEFGR